MHSLIKGKDIYYLPNFNNKNIDITQIFKIKSAFDLPLKFNILLFYDEFKDDEKILLDVFNNINFFRKSTSCNNINYFWFCHKTQFLPIQL
jgi:hypothetical protein